jgi:hypothetical protein
MTAHDRVHENSSLLSPTSREGQHRVFFDSSPRRTA